MNYSNIVTFISFPTHELHVMSHTHQTTTPEQMQTDTMLVFRSGLNHRGHLELIGTVEVPRYTRPDEHGIRMRTDKRVSLAVYRAVTSPETHIEGYDGTELNETTYHKIEGEEFAVMRDMSSGVEFVPFEGNPSFDAVWNPEADDE